MGAPPCAGAPGRGKGLAAESLANTDFGEQSGHSTPNPQLCYVIPKTQAMLRRRCGVWGVVRAVEMQSEVSDDCHHVTTGTDKEGRASLCFPFWLFHQVLRAGEITPVLVLKSGNCLWTLAEVWEESRVKGHLRKKRVQAVLYESGVCVT